jgi:hypothetical protein
VSSPSIETIRAEHAREGIGAEIYRLLVSVTRSVAVRYPPQIYSQHETWSDEVLAELTQTWVVDRLMRGDLALMVGSSASTNALRGQLSTSLRQLIINNRRRDSAGNLYRRVLGTLREDSRFEAIDDASPQRAYWTLGGLETTGPSSVSLRSLVQLASRLSDDDLAVVRYGPRALKSSPILRQPALEDFLVHLLEGAEGALTLDRIAEVMQHRFGLYRERRVDLDDTLSSSEKVDIRVETKAIVESITARLDASVKADLAQLNAHDWDLRAVSDATQSSEASLRIAADQLVSLVAEYADDEEQARAVVTMVVESLFGGGAG